MSDPDALINSQAVDPMTGGGPAEEGDDPTDGTFPTDAEQPETQGDEPLEAELGDDGQGDLAPGDDDPGSGDVPGDLRDHLG